MIFCISSTGKSSVHDYDGRGDQATILYKSHDNSLKGSGGHRSSRIGRRLILHGVKCAGNLLAGRHRAVPGPMPCISCLMRRCIRFV